MTREFAAHSANRGILRAPPPAASTTCHTSMMLRTLILCVSMVFQPMAGSACGLCCAPGADDTNHAGCCTDSAGESLACCCCRASECEIDSPASITCCDIDDCFMLCIRVTPAVPVNPPAKPPHIEPDTQHSPSPLAEQSLRTSPQPSGTISASRTGPLDESARSRRAVICIWTI